MAQLWHQTLPKPIAFVLAGGCALGAIQVGMLRALHEAAIQPDLIVGASVGALNGAVVANYGLTQAVTMLEHMWKNARRQDIFPGTFAAQLIHLLRTRRHLFPSDELQRLIKTHLTAARFADLALPFGVVATRLPDYRATLLTSGEVLPALLASAAIPGLFPAVKIAGSSYIDGAFAENSLLSAAVAMGAGSLIVLGTRNKSNPKRLPRTLTELFAAVLQGAVRRWLVIDTPLPGQQTPIVHLPTPTLAHGNLLNFERSVELMNQTTALTTYFLNTALSALAEHNGQAPIRALGQPYKPTWRSANRTSCTANIAQQSYAQTSD